MSQSSPTSVPPPEGSAGPHQNQPQSPHDQPSIEPRNQSLRLSDEDRLNAMNHLSTHFADGRLTQSEFDSRCTAVAEATTNNELFPLFQDLPGGLPADSRGLPQSSAVAKSNDDDKREIESLKKRGNLIENLDWIIVGVTLITFLGLQMLGVNHAWLVWPSLIITLSLPRMFLKYSDTEEKQYEELSREEAREFREKIRRAREQRRALED